MTAFYKLPFKYVQGLLKGYSWCVCVFFFSFLLLTAIPLKILKTTMNFFFQNDDKATAQFCLCVTILDFFFFSFKCSCFCGTESSIVLNTASVVYSVRPKE